MKPTHIILAGAVLFVMSMVVTAIFSSSKEDPRVEAPAATVISESGTPSPSATDSTPTSAPAWQATPASRSQSATPSTPVSSGASKLTGPDYYADYDNEPRR